MRAKYIIGLAMDDINNRRMEAILFAPTLTHKHAAELFGFGEHVVSAGFFHIVKAPDENGQIQVQVFGESESLQIGPQDFYGKYVKRALGLTSAAMVDEERREDYRKGADIVHERRKAEAAKEPFSTKAQLYGWRRKS